MNNLISLKYHFPQPTLHWTYWEFVTTGDSPPENLFALALALRDQLYG